MKKIYVKDLIKIEGSFEDIFYLHSLKNLSGKKGDYIELVISDKTGELKAYLFDLNVILEEGIYKVKGEIGVYKEEKRVIIKEAEKVEINELIKKEFIPTSTIPKEILKKEILKEIDSLNNIFLKELLSKIFKGEFLENFLEAPAAVKYHHAYLGGLAEHTLNVVKIVKAISECYNSINRDLLIAGALLHDLGKVLSYKIDFKSSITDEGKLLDHIYIGMKKIDEEIEKFNKERKFGGIFKSKFPEDLRLNLLHLIASHHGTKSQGALTDPMTKEAYILYMADMLDAEIYKFDEAIKMAQEGERWSPYHSKLKKSVFIGGEIEND
ncbi:MAG: HD domain-containing protein [candidate division WOR-3 bacterium]